jgi:hypothetical protein
MPKFVSWPAAKLIIAVGRIAAILPSTANEQQKKRKVFDFTDVIDYTSYQAQLGAAETSKKNNLNMLKEHGSFSNPE